MGVFLINSNTQFEHRVYLPANPTYDELVSRFGGTLGRVWLEPNDDGMVVQPVEFNDATILIENVGKLDGRKLRRWAFDNNIAMYAREVQEFHLHPEKGTPWGRSKKAWAYSFREVGSAALFKLRWL